MLPPTRQPIDQRGSFLVVSSSFPYFREERGGTKETGGHIIKYHSKPCNHGNHSAVKSVFTVLQ